MALQQRFWDDLSKREATAIFDEHVASHPARLAAAVDEFIGLGIDLSELDYSRRSLERIWVAELAQYVHLPEHPEPLIEDDVPYWVSFRVAYAERLGQRLCWTITYVAAYFAECVFRHSPQSRWIIGDIKNQVGYRQPLLAFDNGPWMTVDDNVSVFLQRALERSDNWGLKDAQPDGLRRQFDTRMGIPTDTPIDAPIPARAPPPVEEPLPAFAVEQVETARFHVEANNDVDDDTSELLDQLVDRLATALPAARIYREDRELIVVEAATIDADALATLVQTMWAEHEAPS